MATPAVETALRSIVNEVRSYLRDYPELNLLLQTEETSDRQLLWIILSVAENFSSMPPPLGYFQVDQIPRSILLKGILAEVMKSAAILILRNALRYTDGQVTVDLDKHREYLTMAQFFQREYEQMRISWKTAENLRRALGVVTGIHSQYYYAAGYLLNMW